MKTVSKTLMTILMVGFASKSYSQINNLVIGKLNLEPGTILKLNAVQGRAEAKWKGFPKCVTEVIQKVCFILCLKAF